MRRLASFSAIGLALALTACHESPPAQPPPQPPPPAPMAGGGPMRCAGGCPMMQGGAGMMYGAPGTGPHGGGPPMGHPGMGAPPMGRVHRGGPPMARGMGRGMAPGHDAMRELGALGVRLHPPPTILRRAADLGLSPDQVSKIRQEVLATEAKSVDLVAKAEKAKLEAVRLLSADKVDEKAVGAQIDEASKAGAELHKLHLGMVLRVRAVLTLEQLKKLEERKPRMQRAKGPPGPGGPVTEADDDEYDDDDDDDDEA